MSTSPWKPTLTRQLPLLGHRNWIGVLDSAYPWQTAPGIETIATGAEHLSVLKTVMGAIQAAPHVRPIVYLDHELDFLPESNAPGIETLRKKLKGSLGQAKVSVLPHEEIIAKLDQASRLFKVLLFKTTLTLPYTSVFIELDCGYWSESSEKALRLSLPKKNK